MVPPTSEQAMSMHRGVETWDDICTCRPESRWAQVAAELEARDAEAAGHAPARPESTD